MPIRYVSGADSRRHGPVSGHTNAFASHRHGTPLTP
jgi:hypothetical protein